MRGAGDEMEAVRMSQIDHPDHYRRDSGIEAIDAIEAWKLNFNLGNTVKYVARAGLKGDALEDLEKARWYLEREIAAMKAESEPMPMEAMRFTTDGGPLEASARGRRVRIRYGDGEAFLSPEDARSLAGAIEKGENWNIGIAEAMWYDIHDGMSREEPRTALWLRLAGDNCTLTEAQAGPLADVLREMAGKAEGRA